MKLNLLIYLLLSNHFLESKHFIIFPHKLHDMKTTFVDVEVDVAFLEIGRAGLPNNNFRIHLFYEAPGRIAYAFAVDIGFDKQQFQLATKKSFVNGNDHAADLFPVQKDAISLAVVDGLLDGGAGYDFVVFLEMVVTHPKFLRSAMLECPLVVEDELLLVVRLQWSQGHLWLVAHFK